jgi:hypothetical protein
MAYISKNRGYTYGLKTLTQIQALTGMQAGDTCYCTEHFRLFTYDGSFWLPDDCVVMRNRDASTIAQWDVVSVQNGGTTTEISCVRSLAAGDERVVGVAIYSALTGNNCVIAIKGNWKVNVRNATPLGSPLTSSATPNNGKAQVNAGAFSVGVFGFSTSSTAGAGIVNCIIMARKELN